MTGLDLLTDAAVELGAIAQGQTLSAGESDAGLRRLNALIGSWNAEGDWDLPTFADLTTDYTFDDGTERALVLGLAMELCAMFGRRLVDRPDLVQRAGAAKGIVKRARLTPMSLRADRPLVGRPSRWSIETGESCD